MLLLGCNGDDSRGFPHGMRDPQNPTEMTLLLGRFPTLRKVGETSLLREFLLNRRRWSTVARSSAAQRVWLMLRKLLELRGVCWRSGRGLRASEMDRDLPVGSLQDDGGCAPVAEEGHEEGMMVVAGVPDRVGGGCTTRMENQGCRQSDYRHPPTFKNQGCRAMSERRTNPGRPSSGKRRLKELLLKSENRICADCSAPDPKWASANIGVFICLKCCGVHRSLGTHISKVLSVTLDDWSDDEIESMVEVGGNSSANSIYEAFIPEGFTKPGSESSHEERLKFIRSKYELQQFLKPSLRIVSLPSGTSSLQSSFSRKIMDGFRTSNSSQKTEGMVEFIGLLKVKVIKGTNLAIRDMLTSDPYVILTLGLQQVFDYDTFSADDIMGEAEVDIQPLITSAMAFGDAGMFGDMQIGKWLKSHDNALIRDSIINIIDGKVKQEVSLKLQKVESGEIDLELEWMPLEQ
ncbi:hypothetical protein HHK36_001503 [Tetracentron sinense]|uniref:Arf-GAP domain-containing protein n=1 Tax=Tetracentron sinense TaxID=13715 RepID=A0A834ZY85_TETSI|nr:hypothetical protein HHK36_001503 [Tetracentron sinense]